MPDIDTLKEIIKLMTDNKLSRVKFDNIEVVKDLHETKPIEIKKLEPMTDDDYLFNPLKGIE